LLAVFVDSDESAWNAGGMTQTVEKPKYAERDLSQCHFVHHSSHTDRPEIEPGPPRWEAGD